MNKNWVKIKIWNMKTKADYMREYLENCINHVEQYGTKQWFEYEREQIISTLIDIKREIKELDEKAKKEGIEI